MPFSSSLLPIKTFDITGIVIMWLIFSKTSSKAAPTMLGQEFCECNHLQVQITALTKSQQIIVGVILEAGIRLI